MECERGTELRAPEDSSEEPLYCSGWVTRSCSRRRVEVGSDIFAQSEENAGR